MTSQTLEFIGGYDRRTKTGTIPSAVAHGLAQNTRKRPPSRTMAQVEERAAQMGVVIETEGRTKFLSHPQISGYWASSTARSAWDALDAIALDLTKAMSDAEIFGLAKQYKGDF